MFNIDHLRLEIQNLILQYPDLGEDEILRADTLEGQTDLKAVMTELFRAADENKTMVEAIGLRLNELTARRSRLNRRVEFVRDLMLKILQASDLRKIELAEATLSQRKGQPQIIGEPNAEQLPDDLCKISREPDRKKIRDALLSDREVPGCTLSNGPPSLAINAR